MTQDLTPEGPELQPEGLGGFADEEAASEDASHLVPPVRELPTEREYLPAAFYAIRASDSDVGDTPAMLGDKLGQALFQSLTDVHLFGRNGDDEPWLEVGPASPETKQILIAQELYPVTGEPPAEDDLEMFDMVASRVAKTLERTKVAPDEDAASAAARAQELAGLKGQFTTEIGIKLAGQFDAAAVTDSALCIGMKRVGDGFGWFGGRTTDTPFFSMSVASGSIAKGATGAVTDVVLKFNVAAVPQPNKALERMFSAANFVRTRVQGQLQMLDGSPVTDEVARGEYPPLNAAVKAAEDAGLRPGHLITQRLV